MDQHDYNGHTPSETADLTTTQEIRDEIRGFMDSLDESVIRDDAERDLVYGALHGLWGRIA